MSKNNKTFPLLTAVTATMVATSAIVPVASAASFSDIANTEYEKAIEGLKAQGIVDGYGTGSFLPEKQLTRSDVVKMLGKYLVTLGYDIPSDYKTYMRFKDLTADSPNELLQYAAIVYDNGVFSGNQGRLLANQKLSMQHMAVVLVRALSTIDGFDYVAHVKEQRYLQEYHDVEQATTEAQEAINVIDYYDFYKQDEAEAYYYPSQIAERGQFAHFLYHLLEVESPARNNPAAINIESIKLLSPTRLTVALSNGTIHNVVLAEALEENTPVSVSFRINGRSYTKTLTYKTQQLEVENTEFINSGQFVLHFNQEVSLKEAYHYNDLSRILRLKATSGTRTYVLTKGELSEDRRSFKVTLGETLSVNTRYTVEILGIHAEDGAGIVDSNESVYYAAHNSGPSVEEVTNLGNHKVRVDFSEPIQSSYSTSSISYKLADGTAVTGVRATFEENKRYPAVSARQTAYYATNITFDLSSATAKGTTITTATPIYVLFNNIRDIASNVPSPNPLTTIIKKGIKAKKDGVKPKLLTIEQLGAKKMKLVFSEPVEQMGYYDLVFNSPTTSYYIDSLEQSADQTTFILTMDDYLEGPVTITTNTSRYVYDLSGEQAAINKKATFLYDQTPANIVSTEVIRDENKEYLFVTLDRNVVLGIAPTVSLQNGRYKQGESLANVKQPNEAQVYQENDRQLKIPLSELVKYYDSQNTSYTGMLTFNDVYNEYQEQVVDSSVQFTRGTDYNYNTESLKLLSVETSRTNPDISASNLVLLNFNYNVDKTKARDLTNYELKGYTIQAANVYTSNPKQIELIVSNKIAVPVSPYLSVWGLTAENSVMVMDDYYERVPLNETIVPVYQSSSKTGTHEITITYNEALATVDSNTFIVHTSAGEIVPQTVSNHPTDLTKLVLTFEQQLSTSGTYTIDIRLGRAILDLYGNEANFSKISVYR